VKKLERFLDLIDRINQWTGKIVGHLLELMMFVVAWEVVMRYVFNRPTLWAMELNQYMFCVLIALGGGYVFLNRGHVNVDVFYGRRSEKTKAVLDLCTSPILFLFLTVFIWMAYEVAGDSIGYNESSDMAGIPTYPVRILVVVGAVLIFLQALAKFIRDLMKVTGRRLLPPSEKEPAAPGKEGKA
jgi:TRAP-type mannitol/chloroaromatic compound transport system permease small subunit